MISAGSSQAQCSCGGDYGKQERHIIGAADATGPPDEQITQAELNQRCQYCAAMGTEPGHLRFDHLKQTEAEDEKDFLRCRIGADKRERRRTGAATRSPAA